MIHGRDDVRIVLVKWLKCDHAVICERCVERQAARRTFGREPFEPFAARPGQAAPSRLIRSGAPSSATSRSCARSTGIVRVVQPAGDGIAPARASRLRSLSISCQCCGRGRCGASARRVAPVPHARSTTVIDGRCAKRSATHVEQLRHCAHADHGFRALPASRVRSRSCETFDRSGETRCGIATRSAIPLLLRATHAQPRADVRIGMTLRSAAASASASLGGDQQTRLADRLRQRSSCRRDHRQAGSDRSRHRHAVALEMRRGNENVCMRICSSKRIVAQSARERNVLG